MQFCPNLTDTTTSDRTSTTITADVHDPQNSSKGSPKKDLACINQNHDSRNPNPISLSSYVGSSAKQQSETYSMVSVLAPLTMRVRSIKTGPKPSMVSSSDRTSIGSHSSIKKDLPLFRSLLHAALYSTSGIQTVDVEVGWLLCHTFFLNGRC